MDDTSYIWPRSGAFVNVVALVNGEKEFRLSVSEEVHTLNMVVLGMEDLEPLEDCMRQQTVHEEMLQLVALLEAQGDVYLGTIHTYP